MKTLMILLLSIGTADASIVMFEANAPNGFPVNVSHVTADGNTFVAVSSSFQVVKYTFPQDDPFSTVVGTSTGFSPYVFGVSNDGNANVGWGFSTGNFKRNSIENIGSPTDSFDNTSVFIAMSGNGHSAFTNGILWNKDTGAMEIFGIAAVSGLNFDGSMVLGKADGQPATWQGGVVRTLGGGDGTISAITPDDSVIVGESDGQAFRWDAVGGLVRLGSDTLVAKFVSIDGNSIVGSKPDGSHFLWQDGIGVQDFAPPELADWDFKLFSAQGNRYTGLATLKAFPEVERLFVLDVEPVPEPSSLLLGMFGLAAIMYRQKS